MAYNRRGRPERMNQLGVKEQIVFARSVGSFYTAHHPWRINTDSYSAQLKDDADDYVQ